MDVDMGGISSMGNYQRLQSQVQENKSRLGQGGGESKLSKLGDSAKKNEDHRLKEVCKDFQSIFVKQMLDSMRKTVNKEGLMSGGHAEEIFEDMLYDEYAEQISNTADLGLDDIMYQQLSQQKPSL
ncbi:MAG: rod-binding protein [Spirochaetaceae bacterium]